MSISRWRWSTSWPRCHSSCERFDEGIPRTVAQSVDLPARRLPVHHSYRDADPLCGFVAATSDVAPFALRRVADGVYLSHRGAGDSANRSERGEDLFRISRRRGERRAFRRMPAFLSGVSAARSLLARYGGGVRSELCVVCG